MTSVSRLSARETGFQMDTTLSESLENAHAEDLDQGDLARWAEAVRAMEKELRDLRACVHDIRRYCGDRDGYLGWVARRIDSERAR